jgi:hypothetical protein
VTNQIDERRICPIQARQQVDAPLDQLRPCLGGICGALKAGLELIDAVNEDGHSDQGHEADIVRAVVPPRTISRIHGSSIRAAADHRMCRNRHADNDAVEHAMTVSSHFTLGGR